MTHPAEVEQPLVKVGDRGVVVSTLRPAGRVQFGESIVDVVAVADFLDKGAEVKIIDIHGNRVVVGAI